MARDLEVCARCLLLRSWLGLVRRLHTAYEKLVQNNLALP
jgi:hypothetical protein